MSGRDVRVRFAPSPTGHLHVGGVRTALFNWLFAKNKNGKFILRIEDTDRKRSTQESLNDILDSMKWLGLNWDEGPYFQSERISIYQDYANRLLESGRAYKKYSEEKGEAIVFKSSKEMVTIQDVVHGPVEFDTSLIDDFVIVKSDGMPVYNFACVIDDALLNINCVIRGDDHISNTPRQILLYKAFGFSIPEFAHVPMILGPDGSRLSKRHGATSVSEYRMQGVLPQALVNFLSLLGWAPGGNQEILNLDELISKFSLKRITGKSAVFNVDKLTWMNSVYISKLSDDEMISFCSPFLEKAGIVDQQDNAKKIPKIVPLFKKRIKLGSDIVNAVEYFFKNRINFNKDAAEKLKNKDLLIKIKKTIENIDPFDKDNIEISLKNLLNELSINTKELMQTIRSAITGRTASPGIFETMMGMGKELVLKHLNQAIEL